MNWQELEPVTIELRNKLIATLTAIRQASEPENISKISQTLLVAEELLSKPGYDIVICGEVKRGKSTFINALIGQELLPTGVKETTSQVFRISNSADESFSLVFTDGSTVPVSRSDLSRYGSQVDADLMGEPIFQNRQLDYIQVNIPFEFLPEGVSIVDTPGLGALYKSHELITNRYVLNASAVVFVFDPNQPMVQQEKAFLEKVFAVTPYVMFVMTKIDCFDEAHWINQISRSETLLKEAFGDNCYAMPKIFPVASATLFDAAQESEADIREELVEVSYFPAAQVELAKLMYQTVGLSRTQFAYDEAAKQKNRALAGLEEQLAMITAGTKEEQEKFKQEKARIISLFEQTWGPASVKRKEVMQEVQLILNSVHNRASQITAATGSIYRDYYRQIEELSSMAQVRSFSESVATKIVGEASMAWQTIAANAQREVMASLSVLKTRMDEFSNTASFAATDSFATVGLSGVEKFQSYKGQYIDASVMTGVGASLLSLAGISVAPIVPVLIIGTLLWGWIKGGEDSERKQVEKNKIYLKTSLSDLMNEINSQMFHVPMSGGHQSMAQAFTSHLGASVEKAMTHLYETEKSRFNHDLQRLDEQAKLGAEQKQTALVGLNEQRKQWLAVTTQLAGEEKILNHIKEMLTA